VILVERLVDGRHVALAEGIVERVVDRRRIELEPCSGVPIDDELDLLALLLLI
jgi:hypothetical protein